MLVSDDGPETKDVLGELTSRYKVHHARISPYNSQANGFIEGSHRAFILGLRKLTRGTGKSWRAHFHGILWSERATRGSCFDDFVGVPSVVGFRGGSSGGTSCSPPGEPCRGIGLPHVRNHWLSGPGRWSAEIGMWKRRVVVLCASVRKVGSYSTTSIRPVLPLCMRVPWFSSIILPCPSVQVALRQAPLPSVWPVPCCN